MRVAMLVEFLGNRDIVILDGSAADTPSSSLRTAMFMDHASFREVNAFTALT